MRELFDLLLLLAAIYGLECLSWVPIGALALTKWWGRNWRVRQPPLWSGNVHGGFLLANPLPPLGTIIYGRQLPLSLSPQGVCAWNPACLNGSRRPPQPASWVPFADMHEVVAMGKKVLINRRPFFGVSSEAYAAFLAETIRQLHQVPPERRADKIRAVFAGQLDARRIKARWDEASERVRILRGLANALLFSAFLAVPVLAWQFGLRRLLWALVGGVLVQTVTLTILYHRAHKALMPAANEERFTWALTMLLAAPTAMRAHDLLVVRAFEQFHPLALAQVLAAPHEFESLSQGILLDLHYPMEPLCPSGSTEARAAVAWSHAAWREAVEDFLRTSGLALERFLAPPARSEPGHLSYCPRCRTQFVVAEGTCSDCGGLPLAEFEETQ